MTYSDLLLPFGEDSTGRLRSVHEVPRGAECGCVCPKCSAPLVARKGDVLQHHFAHLAAEGCGGGALETSLHKLAKQVIRESGSVWIPELVVTEMGHYERREPARLHAGVVDVEKRLDGVQPDALVTSEDGEVIAVEVYVAHAVDGEKRRKLAALGLSTIEIDLSGYASAVESSLIREFVLRSAPRFWLFHAREQKIRDELRQQYERWKASVRAKVEYRDWMRRSTLEVEALRKAEDKRRADEIVTTRKLLDSAKLAAEREAVVIEETELAAPSKAELDGIIKASRMRPSFWIGGPPTPEAFCGKCGSTEWGNDAADKWWWCRQCYGGQRT